MRSHRILLPLSVSVAVLVQHGRAADFQKASNTNALNTAASWTVINGADPDGLPDADDLLIWNSTVTAPNSSANGGDLSVLGLRVTNVGGTRNTAANFIGITGNTNTLTIGASGLDLSTALQPLRIENIVALSANQTWNIADASTAGAGFGKNEDVVFFGNVADTPFNLSTFTVTKTGAGTAGIGTGYKISNGTFNVNAGTLLFQSGGNRATTLDSNVSINVANGATLRVASESGAGGIGLASSAAINLASGSIFLNTFGQNNAMNLIGNIAVAGDTTWQVQGAGFTTAFGTFSGNLTGSGNIAYQNTATVANGFIRFTGDNSGYTGTLTLNGTTNNRILRLASVNSGSANATWSVGAANILQVDGVSVQLGTLTGPGTVNASSGAGTINVGAGIFSGVLQNGTGTLALNKVGPGTLLLSGANTYTGATTVTAGTLQADTGSLGATNVSVANGAELRVRTQPASATLSVPSLALGTTTGATLTIDVGTGGNPATAPLTAATFTPSTGSIVRLSGTNFTAGSFPVIDYTGTVGGVGVAGLTLSLPFRVTGTLVDNTAATSVDVNLSAAAVPVWRGNVNGTWDVDNVGNGSVGTPNWSASTGPNTYVQGSPGGTDAVIFDDTATGTTTVNLSTTLTPVATTVNNSGSKNYTFIGAGKLSGPTALLKNGAGTLTIANTTPNDYTGATTINAGQLQIGNGTTVGAGSIGSGSLINNATLVANRPDGVVLSNAVSGNGNYEIATATLAFANGATIPGVVSGPGGLVVNSGTVQLSGTAANTYTGLTTVSGGTLQLNKTGVNAVVGDILFTGTGLLTLTQANQIADTATITYDKAINGGTIVIGNETFAALNYLNGDDTGAQFQVTNGFNVTGLVTTRNSAVFAVASNNTTPAVGGLDIGGTSTIRLAANSNPTTLTVGSLGITASGGTIQVAQGTGAFDAILNLNGNVTTTGNLAFTDGAFTGTQKREINLGAATRTFNIGAGTTTTVAPDFAGAGGLIKAGTGTLTLTSASVSTYTGSTTVDEGVLLVNGSVSGTSSVSVDDGGTLAGAGSLAPAAAGNVSLLSGGSLAPGAALAAVGTLTLTLNGGGAVNLAPGVATGSGALKFDLAGVSASDKVTLTGGSLSIGTGVLDFSDFAFNPLAGFNPAGTYTLFDGALPITGTFGNTTGLIGGQQFQLQFADGNNDLVLVSVPEPGSFAIASIGLGFLGLTRRRKPAPAGVSNRPAMNPAMR